MGDVVRFSQKRRSFRSRGRAEGKIETGSVVLFTGVRVERWAESETEDDREPRGRPTPPRRRRRRSS